MSNVRYEPAIATSAGAIPVETIIETELQPDGSNRQVVKVPNVVTMTRDDNNALYYEIRINPALTGGSFASVSADSLCNVNVTSTAVTGGRVVFADYAAPAAAGVKSSGKTGILDKIPLAVSALGVGDILSICCIRNGTTNSLTQAALNWTEVR